MSVQERTIEYLLGRLQALEGQVTVTMPGVGHRYFGVAKCIHSRGIREFGAEYSERCIDCFKITGNDCYRMIDTKDLR